MLRAKVALALVFLACLSVSARQLHSPDLADFYVYDAAAELVHEHQSAHLYDGADSGADFGLRFVDAGTRLGQAARHVGIDRVRLYIYPPILADLLLPFSFFSAATAGKLWLVLNFAAMLAIAWLMVLTLSLQWKSVGAFAVTVALFASFTTIFAVEWGQVTVLLLLLWTAGIYFYQRGWVAASTLVLALAAVIKLTPLLIVLPFLVWGDWRWLRAFGGWMVMLVAGMCLVNHPSSLVDYGLRVMPSLSAGGRPDFENKSFLSSMQLLYATIKGANPLLVTLAIPKVIGAMAKGLSALILLASTLILFRQKAPLRTHDRLITMSLIALLSACLAPISWKHAFVVAFLPLASLWADALRTRVSNGYLVLLSVCSIELTSFLFDSVATKVTHGVVLGALSFLAPVTGVVLVFGTLLGIHGEGTAWQQRRVQDLSRAA